LAFLHPWPFEFLVLLALVNPFMTFMNAFNQSSFKKPNKRQTAVEMKKQKKHEGLWDTNPGCIPKAEPFLASNSETPPESAAFGRSSVFGIQPDSHVPQQVSHRTWSVFSAFSSPPPTPRTTVFSNEQKMNECTFIKAVIYSRRKFPEM
jgi:hypothetical protein